jgi:hypothetical protein
MPSPLPSPLAIPKIARAEVVPTRPGACPSPNLSDSELCAIGAVVVSWAKLENSINDLIWVIQGRALATGRVETENLQLSALLTRLQNSMQAKLIGDRFKPERKAIVNLIDYLSATRFERNLVIHGTWAEMDGQPIVGSLKADTTDASLVTFEQYPVSRIREIEGYARSATKNMLAIIQRIESLP